MNNSENFGAVELVLVLAMAAIWAVEVIARDLAIPLAAGAIALASPRRAAEPVSEPVSALVARPVAMAWPMPVAAPGDDQEAVSEAAAVMARPMPHPLAQLQESLQAMPAARLREVTGCKRKLAKQRMTEAWLAMPV